MSTERIEPELIAAFAEGRLTGEERARVIAHLVESPESYELFVEMIDDLFPMSQSDHARERKIDRDLVDRGLPSRTRPNALKDQRPPRRYIPWLPGRRRPRYAAATVAHRRAARLFGGPWTRYAAAAAAVTAIAIGARVVWTFGVRGESAIIEPRFIAERLGPVQLAQAESVYASAWDRPGWSGIRGIGAGLTETQIAFRLGVRIADLTVALEAASPERQMSLVAEQRELLQSVNLSGMEVQTLDAVAASATRGGSFDTTVLLLSSYDAQLRVLLRTPAYELGKWVGAARMATASQDTSFFATQLTREFFDRSLGEGLSPTVVSSLDSIAAIARPRQLTDEDFAAIARYLEIIVREAGG